MSGVVDTHVHVWDPARLRYRWLDGLDALNTRLLPQDVDRGDGATERMVFVQADCLPTQAVDEVRWVASFGRTWPELSGIVAAADLRSPDIEAHLDDLLHAGPVVGIRHLLQAEPVEAFHDPHLRSGLAAVAARGLTFDACVRHPQLRGLRELLSSVDGLAVVLDHMGKPPIDEGITSDSGRMWASELSQLASEQPRLHVKLSGLSAEASSPASFDAHADGFLIHCLDAFGADRSMIGSDWPVSARSGAASTFTDWISRIRKVVGESAGTRAAIEGGSGVAFYNLDGKGA